MISIGERLRQERLRRGLDLYEIAEQTKINPAMLEAIEADDLARLPGSFFTRSFIRQYARALGVDESDLEPELQELAAKDAPAESPSGRTGPDVPPVPAPRQRRGSGRTIGALGVFVLIVVACSAIYGLWQRTRNTGSTPAAVPAARPARQENARPAAPPSAAREQAPAPAVKPPGQPAESQAPALPGREPQPPAAPVATSPSAPPAKPQTASAPATVPGAGPQATQQPQPVRSSVPPGNAAAVRLEMRANAPAWVRVVADGKYLFSGTLQPNDVRTFEGAEWMSVRLGDPGAVAITLNGKEVGEVGPRGQPRTVQFTPAGFKVVTAVHSKPAAVTDGL